MAKPEDIPQDVWDAAVEAYAGYGLAGEYATHTVPVYERIARAIMAATERAVERVEFALLDFGDDGNDDYGRGYAFAREQALAAIRHGSQPPKPSNDDFARVPHNGEIA